MRVWFTIPPPDSSDVQVSPHRRRADWHTEAQTGCLITAHTHTRTNTQNPHAYIQPAGDFTVSCSIYKPRLIIAAFPGHPCGEDEPYMDEEVYK